MDILPPDAPTKRDEPAATAVVVVNNNKNSNNNNDQPSGFILKLFQMVNGAPDEVITWTNDGDAFIIGSDLKRLEGETLPQWFRHGRFASLVRQLNFYSFKKINKERNMWIYKHELFHRDHPEQLHMVRRRTCPGADGRKQRLAAARAAAKNNKSGGNVTTAAAASYPGSDNDENSTLHHNPEQQPPAAPPPKHQPQPLPMEVKKPAALAKRQVSTSSNSNKSNKRVATGLNTPGDKLSTTEKVDIFVDTSMLEAVVATPAVCEDSDDQGSAAKIDEKAEMAKHAVIVSEVAFQLNQYAKKSGRVVPGSRSLRRGVVTPPFGSARLANLSSGSLLTYDDELTEEGRFSSEREEQSSSFIADDVSSTRTSSDQDERSLSVPLDTVKGIVNRILITSARYEGTAFGSTAALVFFCLTTFPSEDSFMSNKIKDLLLQSRALASEFQLYRAALHPAEHSGNAWLLRWEQESSRRNALHEFRVFAVNRLQETIGHMESNLPLQSPGLDQATKDVELLHHASNLWQSSSIA